MPTAHITSADPLGFASDVIDLRSITPSTPRSFLEALAPDGKYRAEALKTLGPLEQFDLVYDLYDTASMAVTFGIAVNTDYLITAFSCVCAPRAYPRVSLTVIKPSAANLIKAYGTGIQLTVVGGLGIVNKYSATSTASFISSNASVSMQALDAEHETSGDFEVGGIYRFGFKLEVSAEAYAAIVVPVGAHASPNAPTTPRETAEGWQIYPATFWTYLDPYVAPEPEE
jgi:hypothetical protein